MPIYIYKAKKGPTEIIDGEIDALSQDDAVEKLNILGLVAVSLAERQIRQEIIPEGAKQSQKEISSPVYGLRVTTATSLRIQDVGIFTLQLSSLIKAGVPVLRVLTLISQQTENKVLAKVTDELGKQIKDGKMLSEAMSQYPRIFNNLYVNMVKAGEKSGTLDGVLQNLAEYRQEEEDIRQKLQAALAYPVLIIIVGIITVFIMLTFFLPKLIGLFEGMRQTLPSSTMLLIKISRFMAGNWHWVLIFLFFLVAVFVRSKEGSKK